MLFPDYSIETQKLNRSFDSVKVALRTRGVKYSVLFPAKLRVVDGEAVWFFNSSKDAVSWLEYLPPKG